jgi:RHS repeat-associated protein
MAGISSKAAGKLENKFKFNKNELQNNEFSDASGLEWYDFNARTYDQQVGRFIQIDPISDEGDQEELTPYQFSGDNPSTFNDPSGKCPWCIGALVGGAVDAGIQLAEVALTDKKLSKFSFSSVLVSAAAGAVGVGIATKIDKAIQVAEIASTSLKTAIKIGAGAATDAATSAASQKIKTGKVDGGEVLIDVVAGGVAGKVAGDIAGKAAKNSPVGKALARQADRAERVAANSTRKARQEAAKQANEKVEEHIASKGAAAGTASSNVASESVKKAVKKEDSSSKQ